MQPLERNPHGVRDGRQRFDGASVRRILERAAREQHHLDRDRRGSFSLEELEQMAAQAGISPEALRAALRADAASPARAVPGAGRARWRRIPGIVVQGTLLAGAAAALFGLMLTFPAVAYTFLWAAAVVSLLLLLGASPF